VTAPGTKADVTIAIPVYNGERYLAESVRSALEQTVQPREVLVFDNCSTDRSADIARSLLSQGSVHVAARNAGAVANFNRCVNEAQGSYFLWLAADDRLHPRHLELCLEQLERHPSAPACLPGVRFIDLDGQPGRTQSDPALAAPEPRPRLRSFLRRGRWNESYCLYRRDALLRSPGFTLRYGTDVLLTWWFLLRGSLAVVDAPLLEYREYPTKTVDEMATSLGLDTGSANWRKASLWGQLWKETGVADVSDRSRTIARQELLLSLFGGDWRRHLGEDVRLVLRQQRSRLPRHRSRISSC
jgi:glycosyltransferase involved in cell wall biosynthesis